MIEGLIVVIGSLIIIVLAYNTHKLGCVDTKLDGVVKDVSETNGSVKSLDTWTRMHEKQDDDRFDEIRKVVELRGS